MEHAAKHLLDAFFKDVADLSPLSKGHVWDLLTALRGPDFVEVNGLKAKTTAVIRGLVCHELAEGEGAMTRTLEGPIAAQDVYSMISGHSPSTAHFAGHIQRAFDALDVLGYAPTILEKFAVKVKLLNDQEYFLSKSPKSNSLLGYSTHEPEITFATRGEAAQSIVRVMVLKHRHDDYSFRVVTVEVKTP